MIHGERIIEHSLLFTFLTLQLQSPFKMTKAEIFRGSADIHHIQVILIGLEL